MNLPHLLTTNPIFLCICSRAMRKASIISDSCVAMQSPFFFVLMFHAPTTILLFAIFLRPCSWSPFSAFHIPDTVHKWHGTQRYDPYNPCKGIYLCWYIRSEIFRNHSAVSSPDSTTTSPSTTTASSSSGTNSTLLASMASSSLRAL